MHPVAGHSRVVFLKPLIRAPNIEVGDDTYYDDPVDPAAFERENVLYAYGPQRLVIGRYCALATGVRFIMAGANHPTAGVSTFPFAIFGGAWAERTLDLVQAVPSRGDTIVSNDVWISYQAVVMPGVRSGDGAIVAAEAVVTRDVPPYGVVAGNPARLVRTRFDETDVDRLLRAAWWHWPVELVTEHARIIMAGRPAEVEAIARSTGCCALWPRPPLAATRGGAHLPGRLDARCCQDSTRSRSQRRVRRTRGLRRGRVGAPEMPDEAERS
jgi:virginiamycin A acetyltransferase